ncbi:hypothetical protein EVAR_25581_1 [Eumeta japonica]|uniref:Uncharacterized protein n=1 Tax=Eumeta variegata TaxID=151549 RepID=A0A4C1V211_EUMVA|nr:hypothetical protein EVAR_25581_1 [Eumeta japonica]
MYSFDRDIWHVRGNSESEPQCVEVEQEQFLKGKAARDHQINGHSQLQRSHQCVIRLLGKNRVSDGGGSEPMEGKKRRMVSTTKLLVFAGSESPTSTVGALGAEAPRELPNELSAPYEVPQFPIEQIEKKLLIQRQLNVKLVPLNVPEA